MYVIFSSDSPSPSHSDLDLLPICLFVATPCEGKKKSGNFSEFVREMREKSGNFTFIFSARPLGTLHAHSVFYEWVCYFVDILNFLNRYPYSLHTAGVVVVVWVWSLFLEFISQTHT